MRSRIHLIVLFMAIILIGAAQTSSLVENRLEREFHRWTVNNRKVMQIMALLNQANLELGRSSREDSGKFREVKNSTLEMLGDLDEDDRRKIQALRQMIESLQPGESTVETSVERQSRNQARFETLRAEFGMLGSIYAQHSELAWLESRRYAGLSRLAWYSFVFVAAFLIFWNLSLRNRVERIYHEREDHLNQTIQERPADLQNEIKQLRQQLVKLRE